MTTAIALPAEISHDRVRSLVAAKSGKIVGSRITFGGTKSAVELKAMVKSAHPDWSSRAVGKEVNGLLTGRANLANAEMFAVVSACQSNGYIATQADVREKSAAFRMVKPVEPKAAKSKDAAALAAANAALEKANAEIEALKALITK